MRSQGGARGALARPAVEKHAESVVTTFAASAAYIDSVYAEWAKLVKDSEAKIDWDRKEIEICVSPNEWRW